MDPKRQLMVRRMAEVVVTGYATGAIKPIQVFPLLEKVRGRYGSELEGRDFPVDFYLSLGNLVRSTAEPDTNTVRIVAYGRMLSVLANAQVKSPDDALDALNRLVVRLEEHPIIFSIAKSDVLGWLLGDPQSSDPPGVLVKLGFKVGMYQYPIACEYLARIREDQGVITDRTVSLFLDGIDVRASFGQITTCFNAAATGKLMKPDQKPLEVDEIETLARYAIRMDQMVSAEQLAYKLVSMETKA